jgi:subtilisin-like proprotein convertase family protein
MNTATARKKLSLSAAVTASTVIAGLTALPASASSFTGTGSGFTIPDNNPAGASSTIVVPDSFSITDITVTLNNLTHNFVGDLIATLTHVDTATTVSLFNRVGRVNIGSGDSSILGGDYSFNDAFTGDLWAVAASGGGSFVIPSGDYFPTGANSATEVPMLASLGGQLSSGTWRLTISDNSLFDTGALGGWTLNLQGPMAPMATVPEPSSNLGLLALGLLGAGALVKRKLN